MISPWTSDNDEINSTVGYVFTLATDDICWKSYKPSYTPMSTIDSKFIALKIAGLWA